MLTILSPKQQGALVSCGACGGPFLRKHCPLSTYNTFVQSLSTRASHGLICQGQQSIVWNEYNDELLSSFFGAPYSTHLIMMRYCAPLVGLRSSPGEHTTCPSSVSSWHTAQLLNTFNVWHFQNGSICTTSVTKNILPCLSQTLSLIKTLHSISQLLLSIHSLNQHVHVQPSPVSSKILQLNCSLLSALAQNISDYENAASVI